MKLLKFTRYSEWWEYKMVPLLAIAYASINVVGLKIEEAYQELIFSLLAIIVGAVYVSVINDITDIKEDQVAGKANRMAPLASVYRIVIISFCVLSGIVCGFLIYPNLLGVFFYAMAWISFSLYSLPPIRLKKRGVWGILCDAMGAHLFPTLFIVSNLAALSKSPLIPWWYLAVGIWSITYGLRGILWHQFFDRNNDLKSGTETFASKKNPENFQEQELCIFIIEVAFFTAIFIRTLSIWTAAALAIYIILVFIRTFVFKYRLSLIITPAEAPHQILMNDFYLVFFPLSLLLSSATAEPKGWIFVCCHLLLFPRKTIIVYNDLTLFLKRIVRQ